LLKSIETQIAEAAYAAFTTPAAMDRIKADPSLFHLRLVQLWPHASDEQIIRGVSIAAELLAADVADVEDEFRRGDLVLPEKAKAGH